ncbi:T9SS type A sorting domain-containing protein [Psychroserpens algicola]|uniref:T9SS type A sorting domain-containing protein n=1 Tax=Psychroserpens algicola TaxID=1719034 RepID=A0ABT0H411_9FLAO|nr:T9SS type A sorting domain-containing protein [Psychroserpens algicola]MCK8479120.1 T9SS type A sorting domain-containing protein [Psychroserpens algicola]
MKNKTTYIRNFYLKAIDKRFVLTLILALTYSTFSFSQVQVVGGPYYMDGPACEYPEVFDINNEAISIPSAVTVSSGEARGTATCSVINVTYNGFSGPAQTAFQYAVDIWANTIESTVPITINANYVELNPGVLGSAGATGFYQLTGGDILPNTIYPAALAEKLVGTELGGANSIDIQANFSNQINWYFGLDASPSFNQFDFVSVVLHELGHGLGFLGFGRTNANGTEGLLRNSGFLSPYDNYVENGAGIDIDQFADPSFALLTQYTSGDLFSNSPLATAANNGVRPEIWAPSNFNPGSSYSHWDDNVFPNNNENSLMTPSIGNGQANHNTGPITRALFEEMGWTICDALSVDEFTLESLQVSPNPFNEDIRIVLPGNYNDSDFNISVFDINGRVIFEKETSSINRIIDLNLSELQTSVYFMKINDTNSGLSVTKKIVRQ